MPASVGRCQTTLDSFVSASDSGCIIRPAAVAGERQDEPQLDLEPSVVLQASPGLNTFCRQLQAAQRCGGLNRSLKAQTARRASKGYKQTACWPLRASCTDAAGNVWVEAHREVTWPEQDADHISCSDYSDRSQQLAICSSLGVIAVHSFAHRQHLPPSIKDRPLHAAKSTLRRLEAVRWHPSAATIGAVARGDLTVGLHDQQRELALVQSLRVAMGAGNVTASSPGLHDLAFSTASPSKVVAAGISGQAFVWDTRAGCLPKARLSGAGPINVLQLAPDGYALLAGTVRGQVLVWDLRGGSGAPSLGARGPVHHALRDIVSLQGAMGQVPGLLAQTVVPSSAVHDLLLDPGNQLRCAFHLGCGWSGVLDLAAGKVTHVHCPPPRLPVGAAAGQQGEPVPQPPVQSAADFAAEAQQRILDAAMGFSCWRVRRRRAAWSQDGQLFAVPSGTGETISLLDFSPGSHSPCAVEAAEGGGEGQDPQADSWTTAETSVSIPVSEPVVALSMTASNDTIYAGTQQCSILQLSH